MPGGRSPEDPLRCGFALGGRGGELASQLGHAATWPSPSLAAQCRDRTKCEVRIVEVALNAESMNNIRNIGKGMIRNDKTDKTDKNDKNDKTDKNV